MQARPPTFGRNPPEIADSLGAELLAEAPWAGGPPPADHLIDEIRRLRVLAEVADTVTDTLSLDRQLPRLIDLITKALDAERATLFHHDGDAGELFSRVLLGDGVTEIRLPATAGRAGAVCSAETPETIPDVHHDPRLNPEIYRRTGYHTR